MRLPIAYGIDFGTTNSAIAVAYDDGTTAVVGTPDTLTQSLIYLHRNGNQLIGLEAARTFVTTGSGRTLCSRCSLVDWSGGAPLTECRSFEKAGGCFDSRLIAQVKSDVADPGFSGTHSWGTDFAIDSLISTVLRRLKTSADRELKTHIDRATIGHPVRFAGAAGPEFASRQALALSRIHKAAELAGFTEHAGLMEESKAAIAFDGVADGILLCLDFGGGTFDVAVVDIEANHASVLALNGVSVGGEEFDSKIFDGFVAPQLNLDATFRLPNGQTRTIPALLRSRLRSLSGINQILAENLAAATSQYLSGLGSDDVLRSVSSLVSGAASWNLFTAIQAAKHDLSSAESTTLAVQTADFQLQVEIDRGSFEHLIDSDLKNVEYCITDALHDAAVQVEEINYVALTGGSSQIPAFRKRIQAMFPTAVHTQMDPFTSVVEGLARHAYEEWAGA